MIDLNELLEALREKERKAAGPTIDAGTVKTNGKLRGGRGSVPVITTVK